MGIRWATRRTIVISLIRIKRGEELLKLLGIVEEEEEEQADLQGNLCAVMMHAF